MEDEQEIRDRLLDLITKSGAGRRAVELLISLLKLRALDRMKADWHNSTLTDISKGRGCVEAMESLSDELEQMRKRAEIMA